MIRETIKKQLISILNMMIQLHHTKEMEKPDTKVALLSQCQESAITVGNILEQKVEEASKIVLLLEFYCEAVYAIAGEETTAGPDDFEKVDAILYDAIAAIEEVSEIYQIVFMPYKAAMWDSLESIYLAAAADPRCEALVVPIPYFSFDQKKQEWIPHYEGNLFPVNIPITSYQTYNLQEERPDAIYVHNPYDDANIVTTVHPSFYSKELKKYTRKLIYVPYYVTTGPVSPEHTVLPVYLHMNYAIVQGEYFKSGFQGLPYADKIKPFGSPKLDRVIRMCQSGEVKMPAEWADIMQGRRILMLNTSISCLLGEGSVLLDKLMSLFRKIKEYPNLALIWRPHPLLYSTMQSMRPKLQLQYEELVKYFKKEKIGVFDDTPDITPTVALADGYVGELGTSVVNLFGAAGKPMLILNDFITEEMTAEQRRRFPIQDIYEKGGKIWAVSRWFNGIFSMDNDLEQVELATKIPDQQKWQMGSYHMVENAERLYFSSYMMTNLYYLDEKDQLRSVLSDNLNMSLLCYRAYAYQNYIFYLPAQNGCIIAYDIETGEVKFFGEAIEALKATVIDNWGNVDEETWDCAAIGEKLYITANYSNKLLCFDMETLQYEILAGPEQQDTYTGIVSDGENLYLAGGFSGAVYKWNPKSQELIYRNDMPDTVHSWKFSNGRSLVHRALVSVGDWIVTVPGLCDGMLRIEKENGRATCIATDFWKDAGSPANNYHPSYLYAATFGKAWGQDSLLAQRGSDYALAKIDVKRDTFSSTNPMLTESSFAKLIKDEDGFEKPFEKWTFMYQESPLFPVDGFLHLMQGDAEKLAEISERQRDALADIAANLDGSCGGKTHAFVMEELMHEKL